MKDLSRLQRRLLLTMGLAALIAFLSGAGFETPFQIIALASLVVGMIWQPSVRNHDRLEAVLRLVAVALAVRAVLIVLTTPEDVVLPMVDVLLALLTSEAFRPAETTDRSRMYTITFALMVGAAAYRAGVAFGLAFVVYSTVATVALMIGFLIRESQRFEARPAALQRKFLWKIAALSSVMLFTSGVLFIAFPRVTRSWVTRGATQTKAIVGFSDRVSLEEHGSRIYPNPEIVLRVEFPNGVPPAQRDLYWRGRSYDFFDGKGWWHSPRARTLGVPTRQYRELWPAQRLRPKIYAVATDLPVLFTLHPTLSVRPFSRMRSSMDVTGDVWFDGIGPPIYEVIAPAGTPSDQQLMNAGSAALSPNAAYLQLPELSPAVRALADSIAGAQSTQIGKARAIEAYLRTFRYTLELPRSAREATLDFFLFRRKAGHCEYFSTAMAVMMRSLGIPARNVNGFLGGEWNQFGNYLTVDQNRAHSWVEVWFPQYGWVTFDPTPAGAGDAVEADSRWLGPLRSLVDGMEFRWNKWILEYNLDTQIDLFRRAANAVSPTPSNTRTPRDLGLRRLVPYLGVLFILVLLAGMWRSRSAPGATPLSAVSRQYVKLRRLYHKAGLVDENVPPLTFVQKLEQQRAPGSADVAILVDLYIRTRFAGEELTDAEHEQIAKALQAARTALRQHRAAA
jgi:protein-glutamine gamma-glutamyltransferase